MLATLVYLKRYDVVRGDATTAGGLIWGDDGNSLIDTREQAYDGDPVSCPVCTTIGEITCDGLRTHPHHQSEWTAGGSEG